MIKLDISTIYPYDFVNKIKYKIARDIKISVALQQEKFVYVNDYFKKINLPYNIFEIIDFSLDYIEIKTFKEHYTIQFNEVIEYKDNVKLINLIKIINYGNLELRATNIYTDTIENIKDNIDNLYNTYKLFGMVI